MRSLLFTTAALFAISCGPALAATGGASTGANSNGNGGGGGNGRMPPPAAQSIMPKVQPPSYGVTTNNSAGPTMSGTSGSRSTMGSSSTRNGASASNSTTANTQQ